MIALRRRPVRAFCEVDQWSFDPRYTRGRCPICGWVAPGAPDAPRWLALAGRLDWDMLGLFFLVDVLLVLGLVVAHAAGLMPAQISGSHVPAPGGVASSARLH